MNRRATRALALATTSALLAALLAGLGAGGAALGGAAQASTPRAASWAAAPSGYGDVALKAYAYGSRLRGGDVPAGSGMTAFSVIGCSVRAGVTHHNELVAGELPGAGTVSDVTTRVWSERRGADLSSWSRSTTAEVVLAGSPLGSVSIRGITSLSHAWYDGSAFHSETSSSIGKIVFTPPVGGPQVLDLPTPGQPVTVPGLATITLGAGREKSSSTGAAAAGTALRVKLLASGTELFVSRTKAQALSGVEHGRFGGYSAGTEAEVLGGLLTSGRNPLSLMPCQGTGGTTQGREGVDIDLGGGLHVEAATTREWAQRFAHRSRAWERGSVGRLDLGGGALVIDGVVGKATVVRTERGRLTRSTAGTRIGSVTANGEPQTLPVDQVLEIPGVARLEPAIVTRLAGGLKVVALRVTLLDGSGAVIDLGIARTTISR